MLEVTRLFDNVGSKPHCCYIGNILFLISCNTSTGALFFVTLQPQNILLSKDGSDPDSMIKLVDFGLSKYISAGLEIREILGTPDYVGEYPYKRCNGKQLVAQTADEVPGN